MRLSSPFLLVTFLSASHAFTSNQSGLTRLNTNSLAYVSSDPIHHQLQKKTQSGARRTNDFILGMAVPTLDSWTITPRGEAYGVVKNHPDPTIQDGETLTTSTLATKQVQCKEGKIVTTASGSKYRLGTKKGAKIKKNNGNKVAVKSKARSPPLFRGWGGASKIPALEDWRVTIRGEVKGIVKNHPSRSIDDGDVITTSKMVEDRNDITEGQTITTASGSKYTLGKRSVQKNMFRDVNAPSASSRGGTFPASMKSLSSPPSPPPPAQPSSPSRTFDLFGQLASIGSASVSGSQQIAKTLGSFSIKNDNNAREAPAPTPNAKNVKAEAERIANLRDLKIQYGVNGKSVGDGRYLLCGKPQRSTSGKSNIWSAYRADNNGLPTGAKLTIKVSSNFDAISRESENYNRVCSGLFPGRFVEKSEFLPTTNGSPAGEFKSSCALVIESGRKDLKAIMVERGGRGFEGRAMRDAASAALQCVQAMHSSGIVWTDLKTENFVIVSDEIGDNRYLPGVKGIDLESAIPKGENPVDFSPEACPPEFASAFVAGEGLDFTLDYSYDIWSYGMMLYELATGNSYFGAKSPAQITKSLQYGTFVANVSAVSDSKLRDLIQECLQTDPKKRPKVNQLLLHPYFLSTGFGPFGF